jgi:hypothetical protein
MSLHNAIIRAVTKGTAKWAKQRKAEERHASAIRNRRERLIRRHRVTIKDVAWARPAHRFDNVHNDESVPRRAGGPA